MSAWLGQPELLINAAQNDESWAEPGILTDRIARSMIEWMEAAKREEHDYFLIHPKTSRILRRMERFESLYTATALPRYKLRKCVERKVLARRKQGRRRITRLERKENQ